MKVETDDILGGRGVEIDFDDRSGFLKIKETLTRIGVASERRKILHQSCHILHKRGRYFILHFKELFELDNKISTLDEEDIRRRDIIVHMLHEWGLCRIIDDDVKKPTEGSNIYVLPYSQKQNWSLMSKYQIGVKTRKSLRENRT